MLYERWLEIARARPEELALRDLPSGRQWTFHELETAVDASSSGSQDILFPSGLSAEFILAVLRTWRAGKIICPMEADQRAPEIPPGLPAEIVHLKMTSGTTGSPRFVAFTASQLMADAENIVATMGLRSDWPNLGVISLAHSYGFSNLVLPLLLHGIPLVLAGAPLPEIVRQAAKTEPSITLAAVPALWRTWHDAGAIPRNIRLAISAGAPLPVSLEQNIFASGGLKIHNFYGSSECGGIAYDAAAAPRQDDSCAGAPMRNVDLAVGDDGCLEVRSKAVGQSYWPEPGGRLAGGVFRTNDLAEISHGLVYFRGRAGDQINVAGRKVSPESIEKILLTHPGVRECVVFGVPSSDAQRGDTIVACVSAKTSVASDALKQFLLAQLPAWQVPREWWLVESLFASQRGKLSRVEWRKRYLEKTT
ncbi:MAG TPA: class I adenylate-forming enzyme family protein [Verrucomicrobiae bacterium]|jgi:acyl-CoA synthetase (AMP-forming)/AMP-acid ligase II|nr:class I adenylate-forming enzyme family protein [Verrucomicrobiae bacterium]